MTDAARPVPVAAGPDRPSSRRRVVVATTTGVVLALLAVGFAGAVDIEWQTLVDTYTLTNFVIGLGLLVPGAIISWFRPRDVIGLLFEVSGLGHLASASATMIELFAFEADWPTVVVRTLSTVSTGAWQVGLGLLFPLALLLFPDGRLPGRRWLAVGWLIAAGGAYQALTGMLSTGSVLGDAPELESIVSIGLVVPEPINETAGLVSSASYLLVVAALVLRYVRGDERTRRQLLWLILALIGALVINAQRWATGEGPILLLLSFVLFPTAIVIAIVRDELFDIRLVLSRTLLYGLTLSVLVAVYAGLVTGFSLLVPEPGERGVSIAAAIVVAIAFTPLRVLVQRMIDRAFYGTRSDTAGTAWRIGERLRDADDLAGVLDRTRAVLRLAWLTLRSEPGGTDLATAGTSNGTAPVELALSYQGDLVGTLVVGLRRGERRLHEDDRRTLELIGTPLAVALHATALSEQVQQARTATVEAGAAERVRLQRELHDGLGPTLASVTFRADAASNLIHSNAGEAERLLGEVRGDLRTVLDHVRRVVYGLRPIELDDLGLVGALSQRVAGLHSEERRGITVELDAPQRLSPLSPAVELAAYRIASEALANVLRHSDARQCVVSISVDGDLVVTVRDDGTPPASWHPGVGLHSIIERAEELGGSATAGPADDGWEVSARLPLQSDPAAAGFTPGDGR